MIFQKKITGKVGGKGVELCFEKLWENREGASSELRCPHAPSHSPCWARKKAGLCRGERSWGRTDKARLWLWSKGTGSEL